MVGEPSRCTSFSSPYKHTHTHPAFFFFSFAKSDWVSVKRARLSQGSGPGLLHLAPSPGRVAKIPTDNPHPLLGAGPARRTDILQRGSHKVLSAPTKQGSQVVAEAPPLATPARLIGWLSSPRRLLIGRSARRSGGAGPFPHRVGPLRPHMEGEGRRGGAGGAGGWRRVGREGGGVWSAAAARRGPPRCACVRGFFPGRHPRSPQFPSC